MSKSIAYVKNVGRLIQISKRLFTCKNTTNVKQDNVIGAKRLLKNINIKKGEKKSEHIKCQMKERLPQTFESNTCGFLITLFSFSVLVCPGNKQLYANTSSKTL